MVKLEEVEDEAFVNQAGDEEGDWDTDSVPAPPESETSSLASETPDETLLERLAALSDIIPPSSRRNLASTLQRTSEWGWWGVQGVAKLGYLLSASVILLGIPYAIAVGEDQQIAAQEREMQMQQRDNEVMAPGATTSQKSGQSL